MNHHSLPFVIKEELKDCVDLVRQYIPLQKYPEIYVVQGNKDLKVFGTPLPDWVRALTIRDTIYILDDGKDWSIGLLKKILCHELFHVGVYIYFGNKQIVPYWFNEAVAFVLGQREFSSETTWTEDKTSRDVSIGLPAHINDKDLLTFIRHVSKHISENVTPESILRTLKLAKKTGDFEKAMCQILRLELSGMAQNKAITQH